MSDRHFAISKPEILELLTALVSEVGTKALAAQYLGVSRTAVSLYMSGRYPGNACFLESKMLLKLLAYPCPHTGERVNPAHCSGIFNGPCPTYSPAAYRQWQACQVCIHNPTAKEMS